MKYPPNAAAIKAGEIERDFHAEHKRCESMEIYELGFLTEIWCTLHREPLTPEMRKELGNS